MPRNSIPTANDQLVSAVGSIQAFRSRVAIADINAGATLLAAMPGYKYRLIDAFAVAIGGNAATVTTVDILGTQSASSVKLVAFAQANLTRSTVVRAGATGGDVLADGDSFVACDTNTAITIGKTGSDIATATHVDVALLYAIVEA